MKMFCFTSVRRLGLPVAVAGLTADRAKCNPHFCCCSTRQTRTWVQSLRSELTRRRQCIGWNWSQDRRERQWPPWRGSRTSTGTTTSWQSGCFPWSLLCGISFSLAKHILTQTNSTNKLFNKQPNSQISGQELSEAGVPPCKASKVARTRLRKTKTGLRVRETEHRLSGWWWPQCADANILFF